MNQEIRKRIEDINNGIVPEGYKKTEFGVFPCDWDSSDCQKLFEIIDGDRGKNYPKENELKESGFCLFLNANNVTKNGFCFDDKQFISKIKDNALKKGKLKRNDIVVTTRGTVGNFALYGDNICYENLRINSGMAILRSRKQMNLFYAYQTLKSFIIDNYVQKISFGSAQPQLTISLLNKMPIVIPNKTEQAKIAEILMKWDEAVELQEHYIQKLEIRKKAIMQKLLTPKDDWECKKLGDICSINTGKLDANAMVENGKYPFFTCSKEIFSIDKYSYDCEALLMTGNGDIGDIKYYKGKFDAYQRTYVLLNFIFNIKYVMYYLMLNFDKYVMKGMQKSSMPYIKLELLQNAEIYYDENSIGETVKVLEKVDEEIFLQKEKLAKIKKQRKAMQQYLLTGIVRVVFRG